MICIKKSDDLIFKVKDNGIGISEEIQQNLFRLFGIQKNNFSQGSMQTGVGLGLTVSKALTEGLGGTINLKSEESVGTQITLKFNLS